MDESLRTEIWEDIPETWSGVVGSIMLGIHLHSCGIQRGQPKFRQLEKSTSIKNEGGLGLRSSICISTGALKLLKQRFLLEMG